MVARPQSPHTHGVGRADPERLHHHGEHGNSWSLDRKTAPLFPRDINRVQGAPSTPLATPSSAPSKKRKRCQSPPPSQFSKPTSSAGGPQSPKHRPAVAERKPLSDTQQLATAVQAHFLLKTSHTSFESPNHYPNMSHFPVYTPAAAAYATATSFRQLVQQYVDKNHYAMCTKYYGAGPSHAQVWCAQVIITQSLRSGQQVPVINHTSNNWYSNQADAKEAASAEVWSALNRSR
jgi:hypothetical protein